MNKLQSNGDLAVLNFYEYTVFTILWYNNWSNLEPMFILQYEYLQGIIYDFHIKIICPS